MAKKSTRNARKKRQAEKTVAATVAAPVGLTRRSLLRFGAGGAAVLAGGAGAAYGWQAMVRQYETEHDLTQIGKGKPVVVQVHDPQCPTCTALQRETRRAMKQFGECDVIYLVADITQPEGQVFARRHGVQHVTLVLMDGAGEVTQVLAGMRQRSELGPVFRTHYDAHGAA